MKVTDIYEAMNSKAEAFFSGCRLTLNTGCCLVSGCLSLWLARVAVPLEMGMSGSFMESYGSLMIANPETRRRIKMVLVSVLIILILVVFVWR